MKSYKIIGNMTGNSMDASDLVLTEFDENCFKDICAYSKPYTKDIRLKIEKLRIAAFNQTKRAIESLDDFKNIHDEYVQHTASAINEMCEKYNINKRSIDAIGFHGKTLDHYPPSKALINKNQPYTLQIGSGKMLADLTNIPVVYDFRSDFIFQNLEGAPLIGPHNAHIATVEGDAIYYNGGNTSNFAIIKNGQLIISSDAGPCNEYIDSCMRLFYQIPYDKDGTISQKGKLNPNFLQELFNIGRSFYQTPLVKSGDPAYYRTNDIFKSDIFKKTRLEDAVRTFAYFAPYIAVYTLSMVPPNIDLPENIIFFGGGWKNPLIKADFENLITAKGFILEEHKNAFHSLKNRFKKTPSCKYSSFGTYMEARLMADLAYFKLQNKPWMNNIVCGIIARPQKNRCFYDDYINRAAKGWST